MGHLFEYWACQDGTRQEATKIVNGRGSETYVCSEGHLLAMEDLCKVDSSPRRDITLCTILAVKGRQCT